MLFLSLHFRGLQEEDLGSSPALGTDTQLLALETHTFPIQMKPVQFRSSMGWQKMLSSYS